jgi:protein-tyrosine phosphatase
LHEGIVKGDITAIHGSKYFLLELPEIMPPNVDNFLHSAGIKGLVPVITHPERNYSLLSDPGKMGGLREADALFQLTAMSITGGFGMKIRGFSEALVRKGLVDFVATDAHGIGRRRPVISEAYDRLSRMLERTEVRRIFYDNPEAALENRKITVNSK